MRQNTGGTTCGTTLGRRGLRVIAPAITVALLFPVISGCGGSGQGGKMQCNAYRALGTSDRLAAVKVMIDQRGGDDSPATVDTTELSVDAYCFTHPSSATISGIYTG